ncbi:MAG: hypothetical protein SV966_16705 [Actinomycetota bacterium]|nr:hypothetical protein [Actinomycetota bacterium]
MNLLAQGVDVAVIALWLGHQQTQSTDVYLHADMNVKQAAIDRTRAPNTKPGTYRPEPQDSYTVSVSGRWLCVVSCGFGGVSEGYCAVHRIVLQSAQNSFRTRLSDPT